MVGERSVRPVATGIPYAEAQRRCYEALSSMGSPGALLDGLRREGTRGGEQRAFIVGSVLRDVAIVVVGAERQEVVRACALHAAPALDVGLALADELARASLPVDQAGHDLRLLVVSHAISTLPIVAG